MRFVGKVAQRTRQAGPSERRDWRGTPVVPDAPEWMIQCGATDATSASLRRKIRKGVPVMPAESGWMIQRCAMDPTSGSLRKADATIVSLRVASSLFVLMGRIVIRPYFVVPMSEDLFRNKTQTDEWLVPLERTAPRFGDG